MKIDDLGWNINVEEFLEYKKLSESGDVIDEGFHRGNTVFLRGKQELSKLIGGVDNKYIDILWVKCGANIFNTSVTNTIVENQVWNGTLLVQGDTTFSTAGTYNWVGTGNSGYGSVDMYSSLATTITITSGEKLVLGVKWVFTGGNESYTDRYGPIMCACRLGHCGSWDYPVDGINTFYHGLPKGLYNITTEIDGTTLYLTNNLYRIVGPTDFDMVELYSSAANKNFDRFDGFTISLAAESSMVVYAKIVFN